MDHKLLYWPVAVAAMAWMQGRLMPAIRRTPPGEEADEQSVALHIVGTFAYAWAVYLVPTWSHLLAAGLSRVVLFDPVLNLAARRPLFEVGRTALWDKLLRKLAPGSPDKLSAALRVVALAASIAAALLLSSCRSADTSRASPEQPVAAVPVYADGGAPGGKLPDVVKGSAPVVLAPPAPNAPRWQQRQYRKNLRAQPRTVPLIQGRAAVNAPLATQVVASYKPKAPVVVADSGAAVQVATTKKAPVVIGDGNDLRTTRESPAKYVVGGVLVLLAVGGVVYWVRSKFPV